MHDAVDLSYKTEESAKNICCTKGESAVDSGTISRKLNKFHSGFKNLIDLSKSDRFKTEDSEAIEANLARTVQRIFSELAMSVQCDSSLSRSQ